MGIASKLLFIVFESHKMRFSSIWLPIYEILHTFVKRELRLPRYNWHVLCFHQYQGADVDASPEVPFDEYPQACQHVYRLPKKKKIRFYTRAYYVISVKK